MNYKTIDEITETKPVKVTEENYWLLKLMYGDAVDDETATFQIPKNITIGDIPFSDAVKAVTEGLKNDPELREGYKANIAVPFQDAYEARQCNPPDTAEIHRISNIAADYFLKLWCSE